MGGEYDDRAGYASPKNENGGRAAERERRGVPDGHTRERENEREEGEGRDHGGVTVNRMSPEKRRVAAVI